MTDTLRKQLAEQEKRIKMCGITAITTYSYGYTYYQRQCGSLYSIRDYRCSQPLKITNTIKPEQRI